MTKEERAEERLARARLKKMLAECHNEIFSREGGLELALPCFPEKSQEEREQWYKDQDDGSLAEAFQEGVSRALAKAARMVEIESVEIVRLSPATHPVVKTALKNLADCIRGLRVQ
jgi:hypothetical protein